MTFKIENLTNICVAKSGKLPCKILYYNQDNDTVTSAGYIPRGNGVNNGDQIEVISADYTKNKMYYAKVNTNKLIVLTASTTS